MKSEPTTSPEIALIAQLQAQLAAMQERVARLERERDTLRDAYDRTKLELELLKRRIFVAKAERVDTAQLELEFGEKLRALDELAGSLGIPAPEPGGDAPASKPRGHSKGGRRDVRALNLEEQRLELFDPLFEELVELGKAQRIGFEESARLSWKRGGMQALVVARAKYRTTDQRGDSVLAVTEVAAEAFPRSLAAPSLLAHVAVAKHCDGLPLARLEDILARDGVSVDRGSMSRWLEDVGATLGASIVEAMRQDALATAFCIATDATGFHIQPGRLPDDGQRRPCRRGHYFVQIADREHILFTFTPKETSAAVRTMFEGYRGYVQADAKSVFDALFRADDRTEVGCWAHARRKFWEATIAKSVVAREALARIGRIFELDATWADRPPNDIRRLRQAHLKTHVDAFFDWAKAEFAKVENVRGALRDALGYAVRQRGPLEAFLQDGRLELTNNSSERNLRTIAVGRKNWLFAGSDGHAEAAANLMSLIASAKLHSLDPERYLFEAIRALPHWPKERMLELSPARWAATRARLDAGQLAAEFGPLDVPEIADAPADPAEKGAAG